MSASLVGSEMCIRDRQTTIEITIQKAFEFEGCLEGVFKGFPDTSKVFLSCLLYTSDAADDM
eukprot:12047731-Alexandrium_andersonii.AAC.1